MAKSVKFAQPLLYLTVVVPTSLAAALPVPALMVAVISHGFARVPSLLTTFPCFNYKEK